MRRGRRSGDDVLHDKQRSDEVGLKESNADTRRNEHSPSHASVLPSRITRSQVACKQKNKVIAKRRRVVDNEDEDFDVDCLQVLPNKKPRRKANLTKLNSEVGTSSGRALKTWEFYTPKEKYGNRPINVHCNKEISSELKQRLTGDLYDKFKATCFGHFLDMPTFHVQNQVLVGLLFREVVGPTDDALYFIVNNKRLKFGLKEFALVTGLKCVGDFLKVYSSDVKNRIILKYFNGVEKVSKSALEDCFKNKMWDNDEDAIKIAALYLINTFLYSTKNSESTPHYIDSEHFDIIESGEWQTYPWGYKIFHATIDSLHNKVCVWKSSYRFAGMPYALLVWFFECCPTVDGKLANLVGHKVPRILNWEVTRHLVFNELQRGFFSLTGDKMIVDNIYPTELELKSMILPEDEENDVSEDSDFQSDREMPDINTSVQIDCGPDVVGGKNDILKEVCSLKQNQFELKQVVQSHMVVVDGLKDFMVSMAERVFSELEVISKKVTVSVGEQDAGRERLFSFGGFGSDNEAVCDEGINVHVETTLNVAGTSKVNSGKVLGQSDVSDGEVLCDNVACGQSNIIVPRKLDFGHLGRLNEEGDGFPPMSSQDLSIIDMSVEKKLRESAKGKLVVGVRLLDQGKAVDSIDSQQIQGSLSQDILTTQDLITIDTSVERKLQESGICKDGDSSVPVFKSGDQTVDGGFIESISLEDLEIIDEIVKDRVNELAICNQPVEASNVVKTPVDVASVDIRGGFPSFRIFDTQEEQEIYGKNDPPSAEGSNSVIAGEVKDGSTVDKSFVMVKEMGKQVGSSNISIVRQPVAVSSKVSGGECAGGNSGQVLIGSTDCELTRLLDDIDNFSEKDYDIGDNSVPQDDKFKLSVRSKHKLVCMRRMVRLHRSSLLSSYVLSGSSSSSLHHAVLSRKHPFIIQPWRRVDSNLLSRYTSWIKNRLLKNRDPPYHFVANLLRPKFDFGVCLVSTKDWFHTLYSSDNPLQETHIDVILYYLRKKAKYDSSVQGRITTTDCLFDSTIRDIYKCYMKNNKSLALAADKHIIADYIKGLSIRCNTPWQMVDDVFMPIKVFDDWHWIIGRLSFKKRVLYVYDQKLDNYYYDGEVIRAVEPYAILIPLFLAATGFYDIREDLNPTEYVFGEKPISEKWEILHIYDMTGVRKSDYGVFALSFVEHYMHGHHMPSPGCNIRRYRKRFGALLWDYGVKKQEANEQSDLED